MSLKSALLSTLTEQARVAFTGRIHLLSEQRQQLGILLVKDGDLISAEYLGKKGAKAFYNAVIDGELERTVVIICEPEVVKAIQRNIHFPLNLLKKRSLALLESYYTAKTKKPPRNILLTLSPPEIFQELDFTGEEFDLMLTLCHYNLVKDVYDHCPLLEFEITNNLVSLRNKNVIKVIGKIAEDKT
jgi:hypothetical protein